MFYELIVRLLDRVAKEPVAVLPDEMMEGIHCEAYLYDTYDEHRAQNKWTGVLEFLDWLKRRGTKPEKDDGKEATGFDNVDGLMDTGENLLELIRTIALISMFEGKEENPGAAHPPTLHTNKGLEYSHVFLVGVGEGILPYCCEDDELTNEKIEEERRLIYVGITRAQCSLRISWYKKRRRAWETVMCKLSRYIAEMKLGEDAGPTPEDTVPVTSPKGRLGTLKGLLAAKKSVAP